MGFLHAKDVLVGKLIGYNKLLPVELFGKKTEVMAVWENKLLRQFQHRLNAEWLLLAATRESNCSNSVHKKSTILSLFCTAATALGISTDIVLAVGISNKYYVWASCT